MKTGFICSVGTVAGLLLCVGIAPNAYAQEAVLNLNGSAAHAFLHGPSEYSTFTFNTSLILNSVGFIAYDNNSWNLSTSKFYYSVGDSEFIQVSVGDLTGTVDDTVRYFTFASPQTYAAGTQVKIRSDFQVYQLGRQITSTNNVGVSHTIQNAGEASGNIRVSPSNPGSNVAPEPGSFALALTGGAALISVCIRRRRNTA
jgi:hypothetical protein